MLWLVVLLLSSTSVLAQELPQGTRGEHHEDLHYFYQGLFNNKKAVSCCHDEDCRPTQSKMVDDHYEVLINGNWIRVDDKAIIPKQAPDGGAHICAGEPTSMDPAGRVYCVILPPET